MQENARFLGCEGLAGWRLARAGWKKDSLVKNMPVPLHVFFFQEVLSYGMVDGLQSLLVWATTEYQLTHCTLILLLHKKKPVKKCLFGSYCRKEEEYTKLYEQCLLEHAEKRMTTQNSTNSDARPVSLLELAEKKNFSVQSGDELNFLEK